MIKHAMHDLPNNDTNIIAKLCQSIALHSPCRLTVVVDVTNNFAFIKQSSEGKTKHITYFGVQVTHFGCKEPLRGPREPLTVLRCLLCLVFFKIQLRTQSKYYGRKKGRLIKLFLNVALHDQLQTMIEFSSRFNFKMMLGGPMTAWR